MTAQIEDAIRYALDGEAILFVGAGLSFLAHTEENSVPNVETLVDLLLEQPPGTGSKHGLDRVAGKVLRDRGVDFVYDIIRTHFTATRIDPKLVSLYDLPWKRIYTTNYDNAAEVARTGKRPVSSATLDDAPNVATLGTIVHLNGFVKRVDPAGIDEKLTLTDSSYASDRLVETGWLSFFEHDIRNSKAVIFVGYSLYDLDIERVIVNVDAINRKAFFFISPDADEIEISTLARYGEVVPGGVDTLVDIIQKTVVGYRPSPIPRGLTALREIASAEASALSGSAVSKLTEQLVYGLLPEREVLAGERVFEDQNYLVTRDQDRAAFDAIRLGPWRDLLYTGEISSGKSASTLTMAKHLIDNGYIVYYAENSKSLTEDLMRISESQEKIAIIFDGYSVFRRAIADYASRRPLSHRIILTERTGVHEFIGEFVERTPHLGPVFEVALDRISSSDVPAFEALTNFGGFWEERAGASVSSRQAYLDRQLEGSLPRLLLEIIKSKNVERKIRELIEPIRNDNIASQVFCCALILNSLKTDFMISEWQYLFPRNNVRAILQNYREQSRHFLATDSSRIYIRHGLLSSHILHGFMDDELIRECLVELYRLAERSASTAEKWGSLRIELTRFGSIEPLFSGSMKRANILEYYDNIRPIGGTVNNPDYWLQLGIASTVLNDLERGRLCFANAYARERAKRNPNLTRIDNYAARFDMKCAIEEFNSDEAFNLFIGANEKLGKQIFLDSNRHYPFKVGRYFTEIAAQHFDSWDESKQARFRRAAFDIREKALEWKAQKRQHSTDVDILFRETSDLLKKIGVPAQ